MDRIEIKGEIEKESLAKILYHSRAKCNYLILRISGLVREYLSNP